MKTALATLALLVGALLPLTASAQLPTSQVILENASVRVTLLTFTPGGATGRHQGNPRLRLFPVKLAVVDGDLVVSLPEGSRARITRSRQGPDRDTRAP